MPNNLTQFSTSISLGNTDEDIKARKEWVEGALMSAAFMADVLDEPDGWEAADGISGVDTEIEDGELYLYSMECGNPDEVARFIQKLLIEHDPEGYHTFEVAHACDAPRVGEFGGAACSITADEIKWLSTAGWCVEEGKRIRAKRSED